MKIIRAHFDKRMAGRFATPKLHEAQIQRFAKQAFTFDAHANALAFITREAFEPFWEWFLEVEDVLERVFYIMNQFIGK